MASVNFHKTWVSPILAVGFLIISVTGILLLFHVKNGIIIGLHEWIGLAFVGLGIFHLVLNWKRFLCYFNKRAAYISIATISLLALLISFGAENKPHRGDGDYRSHSSHRYR